MSFKSKISSKKKQTTCNGTIDIYRYTTIPSIDGSWGSQHPNGSYGGMIGMIMREEVEFAIADFYITSNRKKVIDFSPALMQQW